MSVAMAVAQNKRGNFEKNVSFLIYNLTGFEESEENFHLCCSFATSNLNYHKFLDVDSHRVTRSLEGIKEKFFIHSEDEKVDNFEKLLSQFLACNLVEDEGAGETDLHYALLSLLMNIADPSTSVPYKPCKSNQESDGEEAFDWKQYLLEEEDLYTVHYADTPPEWFSDEDYEEEPDESEAKPEKATASSAESYRPLPAELSPLGHLTSDESERQAKEISLQRHLVVQYWKGHVDREADSLCHPTANLALDWDHYQEQINPLYIKQDKNSMTEYHLVRETLWMLHGTEQSFVYQWKDDHFEVRQDIQLNHLTTEAMVKLLQELAKYGTVVRELNHFVEIVVSGAQYRKPLPSQSWTPQQPERTSQLQNIPLLLERVSKQNATNAGSLPESNSSEKSQENFEQHGEEKRDLGASQTYQAFAAALLCHLQKFQQQLLVLEKTAVAQEETVTLAILLEKLTPHLHDLATLNTLFTDGVLACCTSFSNQERAAHLLGQLYDTLLKADSMGQPNSREVLLLLMLFLQTCRPYLDIIHDWVQFGLLNDPQQEFIIQRNQSTKKLDENFWDTAFVLHSPEQPGDNPVVENTQWTGRTSTANDSLSSSQTDYSGLKKQEKGDTFWVPGFLMPTLRQVILAGKSMELLRNLGKLKLASSTADKTKQTLYEHLVSTILDSYTEDKDSADVGSHHLSPLPDHSVTAFSKSFREQLDLKGIDDPLMRLNFLNIFHPSEIKVHPLCEQNQIHSKLQEGQCDQLMVVEDLVRKSLYQPINAQYTKVCRTLLDVFKQEYHLLQYFTAIRRFFLMEAGDVMHDFYTEIFGKLRLQEAWQDASFLSTVLQEALHARYPDEADRLSVSVELPTRKSVHPIHTLDGLSLHYKVPWPVDIVMNSRCMKVYNQVFRFLLQIKWVKYSLDELRFCDMPQQQFESDRGTGSALLETTIATEPDYQQLLHHLQLLRMRLMHFVNSLHNYIMTRILHSTGLEFQVQVNKAVDLDELIHTHNQYIASLHERCLLHKKVAFIKDVVTKVLNLALTFQASWERPQEPLRHDTLKRMEIEFSNCIQFLASVLNNIIKRGSFPHLESLAFALITSNEATRC